MRATGSTALLVVLILSNSCGGGDPEEDVPPAARFLDVLQPLQEVELEDRSLAVIEVPADLEGWNVAAPEIESIDVQGRRALRLSGERQHFVSLPIGKARPNLVAIDALAGESFTLRCGIQQPEPLPTLTSRTTAFVERGQPVRHLFRMHYLADEGGGDSTLVLATRGKGNLDWTLLGVELLDRPLSGWLPSVGAEPVMTGVDGDVRAAFGLPGGQPIGARVGIPDDGVLRLSAQAAEGLSPVGMSLVVRAGARREEATERGRLTLESDSDWHDLVVELPDLSGRAGWVELGAEGDGVMAVAELSLASRRVDPPLVLLVTSDTHRADHVGYAEAAPVTTPNLDALADEGVAFMNCMVASNVTLASHASLFTGLSPLDTGVLDNRTRLGRTADTLADRFHAAGWATRAVVSARHLRDNWSGLGQGFERMEWPIESEREAGATIDRALALVEEARDRPLFLWVHLFDAHRPYQPPAEALAPYWPEGRDAFDESLPELESPAPPFLRGLRDGDYPFALYRGEVSYLDGELGRLLSLPRVQRGIVAVTADHGECQGENGLWWVHAALYPSVLHVPLILRWPGAPSGVQVEAPVTQVDLAHTLMGLAGVEQRDFPGVDMLRYLTERVPTQGVAVGAHGHAISLTQESWHLVVHLHDRGYREDLTEQPLHLTQPVGLFDLETDPKCADNLLERDPELTERMVRTLWNRARTAEEGTIAEVNAVDDSAGELLETLGYADSAGDGSVIDLELLHERLSPWMGM